MSETFLKDRVTLHCGDCLEIMATLPENSVDAVVTDPPYGLSFMGKAWDHGVPSAVVWREALRVLKPGGHLVAFAGTRTQHRMATAIEDAGFEIRDLIMWLYGSGFPKSLDVSKAIDKAAGAEAARRWQGFGTALKPSNEPVTLARKPLTFKQEWATVFASLDALEAKLWSMSFASGAEVAFMPKPAGSSAGVFASAQWNAAQSCNTRDALCARMGTSQFELALASSLSTVSSWKRILADLSTQESTSTIETGLSTTTDLKTLKFSASKITPESIIQGHSKGQWSSALACPAARYLDACAASFSATRERSALASAIEQWRRSSPDEDELKLSPAVEPITVARKPLDGTVAANVLRWGTGAINVDGCRVESTDAPASERRTFEPSNFGRWPANLVLSDDPEVIEGFPHAPGQQAAVSSSAPSPKTCGIYGAMNREGEASAWSAQPRQDSGSAARFFYQAKADTDDRLGSRHPTVKPLDLMRWLVRLVTPPGGICLDPFAGTGTTGEAAFREGMCAVLIEREAEYQADIRRRMALVMAGPDERKREIVKTRPQDAFPTGSLFALMEAAE